MAIVTARIKVKGKHYEVSVDLDEALKVKNGSGNLTSALQSNTIFYDLRKGTNASESDLKDAFGTTNIQEIATKIIQSGEVQKTQEFRDSERRELFTGKKCRELKSSYLINSKGTSSSAISDHVMNLILEIRGVSNLLSN